MKKLAAAIMILAGVATVHGWNDHDRLTALALEAESFAGEPVVAEELDAFLAATGAELAGVLDAFEESWAASHPGYPRRPSGLGFDSALPLQDLVRSFSMAIRVNPERPFLLFVQPGATAGRSAGRAELPVESVDLFSARFPNQPFEAIKPGERVRALEVIASASDEPDYGMDIGLYEDNGTWYGGRYGFGDQPFGNPALDYGSQAPFHMSFPWEDPIIKAAAPFVNRGLADYRVALYTDLARFAFRNGHAYWGFRFAGWALHYIQDLVQPYHARLMPGKGTLALLALNALGSDEDIDGAVVLLSNRHMLVEDFQYRLLDGAAPEGGTAVYRSLRDGKQKAGYRSGFAYDVVVRQAYRRGAALDKLVSKVFPAHYASDPSYDFGADPDYIAYDSLSETRERDPGRSAELESMLAAIFADLGGYSRAYVEYVMDEGATLPPRRAPLDLRGPEYLLALAAVLAGLGTLVVSGVKKAGARRRNRQRLPE